MQGNTVVVFSTSPGKRAAVEALGAQYINSKDPADMAAIAGWSTVVHTHLDVCCEWDASTTPLRMGPDSDARAPREVRRTEPPAHGHCWPYTSEGRLT